MTRRCCFRTSPTAFIRFIAACTASQYREIALTGSFEIDVDDYLQANGGIIFPNPNAPTARLLSQPEIERLLQANAGSVVVVDEAYVNFGGISAVPLVSRYPNLLVTHTLSKSRSLAGLASGLCDRASGSD